MGKGKGNNKGRRSSDCNPEVCGMSSKMDGIFERFTENQNRMAISIQKLTDNSVFVEKLDQKLDRVEAKVDKNSQVVWKMVGIATACAIIAPYILKHLQF